MTDTTLASSSSHETKHTPTQETASDERRDTNTKEFGAFNSRNDI